MSFSVSVWSDCCYILTKNKETNKNPCIFFLFFSAKKVIFTVLAQTISAASTKKIFISLQFIYLSKPDVRISVWQKEM